MFVKGILVFCKEAPFGEKLKYFHVFYHMDTPKKYKNRTGELERLINVLRNVGISNAEELTKTLKRTIQSYALQIHIEPLTNKEIEFVWMRLID
jgi:hypothetical protein